MNARSISCACGDGPLTIKLACALERLLSAEEAAEMLERAMVEDGLDALPDDPEELAFFATGPLHQALESSFGRAQANQLMLELAPLLDAAWEEHDQARTPPATHGSDPPTSSIVRRGSGLRRSEPPAARNDDAVVEEIAKADTIPAPSSPGSELAGRTLTAPAIHPIEVSDKPPSSRRFTLPYQPQALVRRRHAPTEEVVVEPDEETQT